MPIKPIGDWFNKKAQKWAEGLYRNDRRYTDPNYKLKSILSKLNPFSWIGFILQGPKPKNPQDQTENQV
jgi:hypothetical protein